MPGAPVQRISFSATSAPPMAAATVSALMLSSWPVRVGGQRAHDRQEAVVEQARDAPSASTRVDVADHAVVDHLAARERDRRALVRRDQAAVHAAETPTAAMPNSRQRPSRRVLIRPFSTMLVDVDRARRR